MKIMSNPRDVFLRPWSVKCRVTDNLWNSWLHLSNFLHIIAGRSSLPWIDIILEQRRYTFSLSSHLDPRSRQGTGSLLVVESLRTRTVARDLNTGRECRRRSWAVLRARAESVVEGKSLVTSNRAREPPVRSCWRAGSAWCVLEVGWAWVEREGEQISLMVCMNHSIGYSSHYRFIANKALGNGK